MNVVWSFKVMGSLADKKCAQGQRVSGILVKKNFSYHILSPSDLSSKLVFVGNSSDLYCVFYTSVFIASFI